MSNSLQSPATHAQSGSRQLGGRPTFKPTPLPPGMQRQFHAMVKPAGASCNLDCTYCYYLHKEELLQQPRLPRMSGELLEEHIRQYIEAQTGATVVFSWQGGEPTLLGLDFFRQVMAFEARHKKANQRLENDLQTNGTLLTEEWAKFLKENNFLVGLSVDGPKRLHDRYRLAKGGQPTHDKVMTAARLLKKYGVPFNVLCVVNRESAKYPLDVYRFLSRELGAKMMQFIPCVEPAVFRQVAPQRWNVSTLPITGTPQAKPGAPDSVVTDWSVDPDDWGYFLCKIWDFWYTRDYGKMHVDIFESAVAQSLGLPSQRCVTAEFCGKGLAIEHNGDVYPCDHYVYPEFRLGNIQKTHWGTMAYSESQQQFGFAKRDTLPQDCINCSYLQFCWGECPKNRLVRTAAGEAGLNYLCPGLKKFYTHIQRDMPSILLRVKSAQQWS